MKVPNYKKATVQPEKLTKYLLDFDSEEGASKAQFFRKYGYSMANFDALIIELKQIVVQNHVFKMQASRYGESFVVIGQIKSLVSDESPVVLTVWQIDFGQNLPRFITAYPHKI